MYYFTANTIAQANKEIEMLDAKVGGLFCILHCLTEDLEENISYTINGEQLRKQLSFVFDKNQRDSFDNAKESYIIFAKNWADTFFANFIKNKVDLLSCAVFFLRRYGFEKEPTNEEVINTFIILFNLRSYRDKWFSEESRVTLTYNQSEVEDNQNKFYFERGYTKEFKSILFNGVIQKSAADLKAAGQIQTLYSGSVVQKCFLLSDESLDKYYIMNNSRTDNCDSEIHNEYERAAKYLQSYVSETGFDISVKKEDVEAVSVEFNSKYSPEVLKNLSDDELLSYIFYTVGENQDALCYWLERDSDCREHFGSISGGSAYKFGLFQKQNTGEWTTGSPQKPQVLSEYEALELGRNIRDALVKGAEIIRNTTLNSIEDYEQLDTTLWNEIGEPYCNWSWFHKYLAMANPDKLSCFHSSDWQRHILYALKIKPSDKYFARSGQLAMIENYARWCYSEFGTVLFERFGGIIQFIRIGTSDDTQNYAAEWNRKSVVGIGWRDIGSLEDYVAGDGLDKGAIADALKEKYGYAENVASRKAGELIRFYKTDTSTVMVAMDGESLIAFVDNIGNYFYDATSAMANMKPGKWHDFFSSGEHLPVKTEGKLTSCYQLTDEDNLMFLYEKYYYGSEEISDEEIEMDDPEERNKRNFRAWMEKQVKPEGDSDAGNPYTENSINQYVSNISNTPLPAHEGHSVFFTDIVAEVQDCILVLERSEKKNNTQRSAVKKYLTYLMALQEVNMPLIYNTDLETEYERNRIVFGAPGTGKSFNLKRDCEEILNGTTGSYERVTFHPDYTYSQFVGTYKPVSDGATIRYEFVPGPFMRVYVEAMKSARSLDPQPHILIIEEINRAKVAAVFGDVFQLLDRDDDGVSEYEIQTSEDIRKYLSAELNCDIAMCKKIKIPNNMFIWSTMNSADQGVFPMDTAFKRRWNFEYLGINENQNKIKGRVVVGNTATQEIEWNVLRRAINEKLAREYKVNEDKLMGPFFIAKRVLKTVSEEDDIIKDAARFKDVFKSKVIMYLYEDAAKQHKHKLFSGCEDTTKYSAVCDSFDEIGIQIFGEDFEEVYYNPQKG